MATATLENLPTELRVKICEMVMRSAGGIQITPLSSRRRNKPISRLAKNTLAMTQVSRLLHSEGLPLLSKLNDFGLGDEDEWALDWEREMSKIPLTISRPGTSCILRRHNGWYHGVLQRLASGTEDAAWQRSSLGPIKQAIRSDQLYLEIHLRYHNRDSWCTEGGDVLSEGYVRKHGRPLRTSECASIVCCLPMDDWVEARMGMMRQYTKRVQQLESHSEHRLGPVKIEKRRFLEGLEATRKSTLQLIDYLLLGQQVMMVAIA